MKGKQTILTNPLRDAGKVKTRNLETRRERRKRSEEKSEDFRVISRNCLISQASENIRSNDHTPPPKSSGFSSGLSSVPSVFQDFWFCSLFLVLHLKAAYNLTNWLIK